MKKLLDRLCAFILLYTINSTVYAQVERRSVFLNENTSLLWVSESYSEIEREYENNTRIIDETYSTGLISSIEYYHRLPWQSLQMGGGFNYLKYGKNINIFDSNLSLTDTRREKETYIGNPFIELINWGLVY